MTRFGRRLPDPLFLLGATLGTARAAVSAVTSSATRRRRVWACPGRLHIETHGVQGARGARVARRIERSLGEHPGVEWARVNAPSARVIVALADPPPGRAELVRIVERAEEEPADPGERIAEDELHHPADGTAGTRLVPTLAADAFGLAMSALTKLAPWAPLPTELAALPALVDHHPKLRELAARRAGGAEKADTITSVAAALAHGLASGGEGTVLDAAQRIEQVREARAHERAWCAAEPDLIRSADDAGAPPVVPGERPVPPPETDVDRYERRVLALGAAAAAAALPFTGPRRAIGLGLVAVPKAAEAGRAAFGAHLGRLLARRGALVMDRSVLRRLDEPTTLVLDEESVRTGRLALDDLVALPGADPHEVATRAWRLFDPDRPDAVSRDDGWSLGPVGDLGLSGRKGVRERERLEAAHDVVLGLASGDRLEALVALGRRLPSGVPALLSAARSAGLRVAPAGDDPRATVRELQADGEVVLVVSGDREVLAVADCSVGVRRPGHPPPWGAHVLVESDLDTAGLLVAATGAAREVTRESIRLAQGASAVGAVSVLNTTRGRRSPASRGQRVVNAGAALSVVNGHRHARTLRVPSGERPGHDTPWHLMPADVVLDRLHSRAEGLTGAEAGTRARADGGETGTTSFAAAFLAELANPLTPVLAGGAALSAAVGSPVDAALVAGVTALSAVVGGVQRVHTDRQLAELLDRSAVRATVRRDGADRQVNADELVPGDVVVLESGQVVPADCRLLEAEGLETDDSSLTGESLPVTKDPAPVVAADLAERTSMLYEGTTIAAGEAVAVVVATGADTEAGRSMAMARENAPRTGVETRLAELTEKSMPVALGSAVAVAGAGLLRGVPLRESMGAAVNLAVASVPEGLPFLVNAAQLAAARRLAELGALVRNPRSVEALGRVDVLCFDKTGTLTEGKLAVAEIDDGKDRHPVDALTNGARPVLAAALRATPQADDPGDLPHATDRAVAEGGESTGTTPDTGIDGWRLVESVPFEPSRGYHAAAGSAGDGLLLSVKGAPENVLPRCAVDGATRKRLTNRMRRLARSGHRVLAVAERELESGEEITDDAVRDLEFRGFVAIADPVRRSAAPAAARLREAGVQIVMITGDHPATGEAIAGEVNGNGGQHVVTGAELDELDDAALAETLQSVDVIARCSPAQKVRIIQTYQRLGRTVAMTGDGANDAPAIRLADVGIALGRHGTPAAKAAADVVVTDDRLETIIAALVEGRAMWASVREALAVLLGGNLGEIAFSVLGAVVTGRAPLGARQFLLVNLLTDLAPALAIALRRPDEEADEDLIGEGPETSLGDQLRREIALRAGTTALGATTAWTLARVTGRARRASTVSLAALVGTQLGQTVLTGRRDRSVLLTGLGSVALLAAIIQTPGVSQFFGCTPLGPVGWSIALGSATAATLGGNAVSNVLTAQDEPDGPGFRSAEGG
ncbi:cation-translocating P-type ATPase [Amycolatopsis suaedae]|uniref:Cation-translocating P-type ATPase n=1 Tax=Amycolatopsis suaedae TaxID=2510978 RepID=A0A4V2EM55_9PSEU|nr:cation-translocating P-type ATPase [Amycolatopsis suaedae]RZQ63885.1 cation-translocating P-type ATPase [Amycolatopsis suaedae]